MDFTQTKLTNMEWKMIEQPLDSKELNILQLIKEGYTNQKISETLFRSVYTIETHRKNIIQKLHLKKLRGYCDGNVKFFNKSHQG